MHTHSRLIVMSSVVGLGVGLASTASANAFLLAVHDGKAMGRGNSSTATDTDPSSIVFNIGGLSVETGTNVMIGASLIMPAASYTDPSGAKYDTESSYPMLPHIFATSRIHDMVAVGIGFHSPFGLDVEWPDNSPGNDIAKFNSIRTYFITPSIGLNLEKYVPGLSVGAGLDLVPATVEARQYIRFGETQGEVHFGGDGFGVGGRIGAMYRPEQLPELSVGAMWRSQVTEDMEGKGDFDIADPYRSQLPPDGDVSTTINIPQSVQAGVAYRPLPQLELEANGMFVEWSKFKEVRVRLPNMTDQVAPQDYKNTFTFSFGAEYKLPQYKTALRAGYIYDPTPIPDTTLTVQLPDANRHDLTAGASYDLGNFDLHLGLLWVLPVSRETSDEPFMPLHKGTYDIQAFVATLTVAGHFAH